MRLFDTARREVVDFTPGDHVKMYVCGVTPYDATHLGHAFTFITYDVLIRRLMDTGRTVQVNLDLGNSITVLGQRYELVQIQFHRPSEARVNGRAYPMSAQLLHKSPAGQYAVVAVLLDQRGKTVFRPNSLHVIRANQRR